MRALGIETATWSASVAIIDDGDTLAERCLPQSHNHGASLLPLIAESLRDAAVELDEIDLIAVSIGPGSFTGLRVGLSVAKGLALCRGVPVVGVPTLEAIATVAGAQPHPLWTVLDARKREVYAAAYQAAAEPLALLHPTVVCLAETISERFTPPCVVVGNAVDVYGDLFRARWGSAITLRPAANVTPTGTVVARLGLSRFRSGVVDRSSGLEPCYVRPPDAERHRSTSR